MTPISLCARLVYGLAKLAGGVAVIRVGGATEVEVKEKKDQVDERAWASTFCMRCQIWRGISTRSRRGRDIKEI
jgi:hypothetical protein